MIYREVARNCDGRSSVYKADLAQRRYEKRMTKKSKSIKFDKEMQLIVKELIKEL